MAPLSYAAPSAGSLRCKFDTRSHCGVVPLFLICLLVSLSGCRQKDLVFPDDGLNRIEVRFLWDNAPDARPEGMTLLFYPLEENGEFWRFEISGRSGGAVALPEGSYRMIAINNDLPGVSLSDMPYESASLTVKEAPRSTTYASPSGMVYEGRIDNLKITSRGVSYASDDETAGRKHDSTIECFPDSISTLFHVHAENVEGIERVRSVSAVIDGPASGILLSTLSPLAPAVAIPFELTVDMGKNLIGGITTGFLSDPSTASYQLTLQVMYHSGGAWEKTFDVTSQVINHLYRNDVYIIIKDLTLPEEPTIKPDEVGIKVDVDGWKVVDINIDSENY